MTHFTQGYSMDTIKENTQLIDATGLSDKNTLTQNK
jgi:hypothetical protein